MALNYPMYRVHDGRRLSVGGINNTSISHTRGAPIYTGAEFNHILRYIKEVLGFHVYANSHFGGIHLTAHGANSWHYVKDGSGQSLGADIGTYGDVNERNRIIRELIPVLDRVGIAWVYARDGHVANHYDHIHIDVGSVGNKGGTAANSYGFFRARRKLNPYTALPLAGAVKKRAPRKVSQNVVRNGTRGDLTRIVQRACNARNNYKIKVDGIAVAKTVKAIKDAQRSLKVRQDGIWGEGTTRAYLALSTPRKNGHRGISVRFVQWVVGVNTDGIFGAGTEKAVRECQAWAGIYVDGIFGANSRNKLVI